MLNFFEQQAAARRRTALCVFLYALAVIGVVACVVPVLTALGLYAEAATAAGSDREKVIDQAVEGLTKDPVSFLASPLHVALIVGATVVTLGLIFGSSMVRYVGLRRGGSAVAQGLGARRVQHGTRDPAERRLLNIVEEMAIASSVPVPDVFVLNEPGINAFAAGHSPSDAAVAVTRGALQRLNRDQLQGVIAHEFSHILNGDMRLNLRLMVLLFGIGCVGLFGRILLEMRGDRKNVLPLFGLALLVIGAVGVFFARLIKAMISRQREFLADAAAAQFTRNPEGLAGALKVIGGSSTGGRLESARAAECSHMMFSASGAGFLDGLMATHPPIDDRIRRLDPSWDGRYPKPESLNRPVDEPSDAEPIEIAYPTDATDLIQLLRPMTTGAAAPRPAMVGQRDAALKVQQAAQGIGPAEVLRRVHESRARIGAIGADLAAPARDPFAARALLLAMLLDGDESVRARQLQEIAARLGEPTSRAAADLGGRLAKAPRSFRLPLIEVAVGTLAAISREQYRSFRQTLGALIAADNRVDLFELCLQQIVVTNLDRRHIDARMPPVQYYTLRRMGGQIGSLLAAVSAAGNDPGGPIDRDRILGHLRELGCDGSPGELAWSSDSIEATLVLLRCVAVRLRVRVLHACAALVGADNRIEPAEEELLRAIAVALDLPLSSAGT